MAAPVRIALFAALLAGVFGVALLAGSLIDPDGTGSVDAKAGHGTASAAKHGGEAAASALPGLAVHQDGYRLDLRTRQAPRAGATPLRFRILDEDGAPVRAFDVAHAKRMHLIVARRDLATFAHVHPELAADGTWTATADIPAAGSYRVFADFTIDGEQHTLGADLQVAGDFAPRSLPDPAALASTGDGLEVRRREDGDGRVAFDVLQDGRVVNDRLQDYLGAKGHLVTLRAGDLAFLHTHPDGDRLAFGVEHPGPGTYRSWVQFVLDGRIRTAAFTEEEPG